MKKITVIVDVLIVILIIMAYILGIFPYFYQETLPEKMQNALEAGDIEYLERQFSDDAMICIVGEGNENRYRSEYVIGCLEEQFPVYIVNVRYLPSERVYEVVYCEDETKEEKQVYVTYAINRVNIFQTKITGMRVEFIE